ncbi:hypothetical protein Bca4012_040292 [Brassica carinata]
MELANMTSVPMSLNAPVRLGLADAIWNDGANSPLSAAEILPHFHLTYQNSTIGGDQENLQRILRMLTSYGVFSEHLTDGGRKYSLTNVGKTLVTDSGGLSYAAYVLQHYHEVLMRAWPLVHNTAVEELDTEPYLKQTAKRRTRSTENARR